MHRRHWDSDDDGTEILRAIGRVQAGQPPKPVPYEPKLPRDVVMRWSVGQFFWGTEVLEVDAARRARYRFKPGTSPSPGAVAVARETVLSPSQLERLREVLDDADVCDLESQRDGVPDEGKPRLSLNWGDLALWDGEWRDDNDAARVQRAIAVLIGHIKKHGTETAGPD